MIQKPNQRIGEDLGNFGRRGFSTENFVRLGVGYGAFKVYNCIFKPSRNSDFHTLFHTQGGEIYVPKPVG